MKNPSSDFQAQSEAEARLDAVFHAYRLACPEPEASADFMPRLWEKIESRRSANIFSRTARFLVTAALAASAILSVLLISSHNTGSFASPAAYVEALVTDGDTTSLQNAESIREMEQL